MNYNQFKNISCYEEFEMQCALAGISRIDILKRIGYIFNNYYTKHYCFISEDGIFNWFDLNGNHIEDPEVLKELKGEYIPNNITKCIIPNSVTNISNYTFQDCNSLTSITIPDSVIFIGMAFSDCESLKEVIFKGKTLDEVKRMKYYPFGIEDESIIKCEM